VNTPKKEYNVAGKNPLSYMDLLRTIADALEKKRKFIHIPYNLAIVAGYFGKYLPNKLISVEKIRRLSEDKIFDYSKAVSDLKFNPISFEEGVKKEINSLKRQKVI
jgi:nucleoside-diphosphate-sugar epimerase